MSLDNINLMSLYFKNNNYSEDQLYSILMAFDQTCIIGITDSKGLITFANRKFTEISGYTQDELLGKDHRLLNSGYHSKQFFEEMWATILGGTIWHGEVRNRKKTGDYYWVNTTIIPLKNDQGVVEKFISIRFDITDQKALDQNITHLAGLVSAGEMAAGLAHELKTPLTFILGKCELIKAQLSAGPLNQDKLSTSIEMILSTTTRMIKLLKGMQELGNSDIHDNLKEVTSVHSMISDAIELANVRLHTKQIKLDYHLENDFSAKVSVVEIVQILVNLLNNATDAIDGSTTPWIKIKTEVEGETIYIRVIDSGNGIPEDIAKKIMTPFFTTKGSGKGSGLGLSISKRLAIKNRGNLYIDSTNNNTCFVLQLPLA